MAPPLKGKGFREGDIIVTPVAHHYAIGRIKADGISQEYLASEMDRERALARACEFAAADHRVFLYKRASGPGTFSRADCEEILRPRRGGDTRS